MTDDPLTGEIIIKGEIFHEEKYQYHNSRVSDSHCGNFCCRLHIRCRKYFHAICCIDSCIISAGTGHAIAGICLHRVIRTVRDTVRYTS